MNRIVSVLIASTWLAIASGAALAHDTGSNHVVSAAVSSEIEGLPTTDKLPDGVIQVSPFVPGMGEHWANPKDLPFGPIYCVMDGHVTCMEYMIAQDDLEAGKSFTTLRPWFAGAAQPALNHMEFNFEPNGHEGYTIPHYDVHMYLVSPETRQARTQAQR